MLTTAPGCRWHEEARIYEQSRGISWEQQLECTRWIKWNKLKKFSEKEKHSLPLFFSILFFICLLFTIGISNFFVLCAKEEWKVKSVQFFFSPSRMRLCRYVCSALRDKFTLGRLRRLLRHWKRVLSSASADVTAVAYLHDFKVILISSTEHFCVISCDKFPLRTASQSQRS